MTAPDGFSLNALIEQARAEVGPDADDIAAKVEPQIPESERHAVFLMVLARYIAASKPRLTQVMASAAGSTSARPAAPSAPARSAKVAAYQEHAKFLRITVKVGRRETKWMADCTYVDLCAAAQRRRDHAAANLVAAGQYEALAELLTKHAAATVGELPTSVLTAFLATGQVAA